MASIYELLTGQVKTAPPTTTVPVTPVLTNGGYRGYTEGLGGALGGALGGGYQQVIFQQSGYQQQQEQIRNEAQRLRDEAAKNEFYRQMQQQMQGQIRAIQPAKKPKMTFVWGEFDD